MTTASAQRGAVQDAPPAIDPRRLAVLRAIEQRVLWLSTAVIDHANHGRPNPGGLKVGGHQASSASMTAIMTALWFQHLRAGDRVSVKPHASPVFHAVKYLLGDLDAGYLTRLREFGGLQSYPSRAKDPDGADYSTGSVGIGATAPVWGALARRYVEDHFGAGQPADARRGRQYSLVGDAELDEGAVWEAVIDPMVAELGEVVWIVDLNRQSLDRIVPKIGTPRLQGMFAAAGWQVITVKYGQQLEDLFARPGGDALRRRIDAMPNPEYQRLLRHTAAGVRDRLPGPPGPADSVNAGDAAAIAALTGPLPDGELLSAIRNLGGHDLVALDRALAAVDDTRPTVIFAYTVKGYGLATEGHPQNHSALLTAGQLADLAVRTGADAGDPWAAFPPGSPEAAECAAAAARLRRPPVPALPVYEVPADLGRTPRGTATTQAALGRALLDVSRVAPDVGARLVTLSPDVSSSTNLAGWVNRAGVWAATERSDWFADDGETILHWRERPGGQHLELGIAEVNMVGAMAEFGATWSRWGQPLIPVGVLYDPFVERALEPWSFGLYAGGQSILVGTPSGVTLAPEGGAHQSIKTASIGIEQPECLAYEPAFAVEVEWTLLHAAAQLGRPGGKSAYLRLSTRPVDQALADVPADPAAREERRRRVVAGAYPLRRAHPPRGAAPAGHTGPALTIVAMGAVVTEALAAADRLDALGYGCDVIVATSPGLLFQAAQARRGLGSAPQAPDWILADVFPAGRAAPMVTVLDGHPHTLAFLAGINRVPAAHLGVSKFGQSGDLDSVYRWHGIDTETIVGAALDLID